MTLSDEDTQDANEFMEANKDLVRFRWQHIIKVADKTGSTIRFHERIEVDTYLTATIGDWGGYLIQVCSMIFNDRLVMTPQSCLHVYDYGWCYPKGGAAGLAALAWDPQTEAEPVGFFKRIAVGGTRWAGRTASDY